jgi:hypothetical protein
MSKTAEYRITLSRLVAPLVPVAQPQPSLCYPDRHQRTDKQVALTTVRYMAVALIGITLVVAATLLVGVR